MHLEAFILQYGMDMKKFNYSMLNKYFHTGDVSTNVRIGVRALIIPQHLAATLVRFSFFFSWKNS